MASIKLILRTHQEDATGHSPLYIRIIKDRKTKFLTTGVKLKASEWDEEKQRVKKSHPNSARMNASLMQKIADAEGHVADNIRMRKGSSAFQLKEAIKGKNIPNFFEYVNTRLQKMKPNLAINTYNSYVLNVEKFKTFMGTSDVYMNEVSAVVIEDYISYMTNVSKNEKSSQKNNLVILKMFFRQAIKEKIINSDDFHFADIRVKSESATKNFLTKEQLEKLTKYKATKLQDYDVYVDMFNFSVYAGGLRFSDVFQLKWSNYIEAESRIRVHIQKTKRDHNFKIGQVAIEILKRYKPANPDNDAYIFNLIKDPKRFESDIYYKNQEIKNYNRTSGKKLSNIGAKLKFPFRLTFHLSRHTFATNALRNGMRIEYVSKIMDHADISTTQIYAKIISEELDKAVDKFIY